MGMLNAPTVDKMNPLADLRQRFIAAAEESPELWCVLTCGFPPLHRSISERHGPVVSSGCFSRKEVGGVVSFHLFSPRQRTTFGSAPDSIQETLIERMKCSESRETKKRVDSFYALVKDACWLIQGEYAGENPLIRPLSSKDGPLISDWLWQLFTVAWKRRADTLLRANKNFPREIVWREIQIESAKPYEDAPSAMLRRNHDRIAELLHAYTWRDADAFLSVLPVNLFLASAELLRLALSAGSDQQEQSGNQGKAVESAPNAKPGPKTDDESDAACYEAVNAYREHHKEKGSRALKGGFWVWVLESTYHCGDAKNATEAYLAEKRYRKRSENTA